MTLPQQFAAEDVTDQYRTGPWLFTTALFDVYGGTDVGLGREVHLRFLKPRFARSEALVRAVVAAAKDAAALLHPNLVAVYDVGTIGGRVAVVTEASPRVGDAGHGVDLRGLVGDLLSGVCAAHDAGLVHGAIDENALFLAAGAGKVADVGLFAAAVAAEPRLATRPPSVEADLRALASVVLKHSSGRDRGLEAVLMRALSADPAERFASGAEMAAALAHCPEPEEPVIPPVPTEPTTTDVASPRRRVARRALVTTRALAPGLLALGLVAAALGLAWNDSGDPAPGRPTTQLRTDLPPEIPR
jgi:hypothetical protein